MFSEITHLSLPLPRALYGKPPQTLLIYLYLFLSSRRLFSPRDGDDDDDDDDEEDDFERERQKLCVCEQLYTHTC